MSEMINNVSDDTFEAEVLGAPGTVLVDYWAEWCGPCKMNSPMLEETAASYAGRLNVAKLDVDANTRTPSRYHVRGIPTLMMFRDGKPVATQVGAVSKSQLAAFIEDNL